MWKTVISRELYLFIDCRWLYPTLGQWLVRKKYGKPLLSLFSSTVWFRIECPYMENQRKQWPKWFSSFSHTYHSIHVCSVGISLQKLLTISPNFFYSFEYFEDWKKNNGVYYVNSVINIHLTLQLLACTYKLQNKCKNERLWRIFQQLRFFRAFLSIFFPTFLSSNRTRPRAFLYYFDTILHFTAIEMDNIPLEQKCLNFMCTLFQFWKIAG